MRKNRLWSGALVASLAVHLLLLFSFGWLYGKWTQPVPENLLELELVGEQKMTPIVPARETNPVFSAQAASQGISEKSTGKAKETNSSFSRNIEWEPNGDNSEAIGQGQVEGTGNNQKLDNQTGTAGNASGKNNTEKFNAGAGNGGNSTSVGSSEASIVQPQAKRKVNPEYPETARKNGWQGVVHLRVQILDDGRVGEVTVKTSSGHAILDGAAVRVVQKEWQFLPARRNNKNVECFTELPIRFNLKEA